MIKRTFDFLFALIALIPLSPLLVSLALLIKIDSRGPIFFRQQRVGKKGKIFRVYKFRTMIKKAGKNQEEVFAVGEDKRITRMGNFLRRWKIDELPQLINIFKGEMSLVGPRPELPKYVNFYPSEKRKQILSVRPGMTSLASIKFSQERGTLIKSNNPEKDYLNKILPQKMSLDLEYVKKQSFFIDLLLIIKTIKKIFVR